VIPRGFLRTQQSTLKRKCHQPEDRIHYPD
jgi:hypothetical protein